MPYGIVKEANKDVAVVIMERQDMCGGCHVCEQISGKKQCTLTCKNDVKAQVGDQVEITLGTQYFLKATYMMYGVPLVGFVSGLGISLGLTKVLELEAVDLWVSLGAIIGTILGILLIKYKDNKKCYHHYLPHIIGRIQAK